MKKQKGLATLLVTTMILVVSLLFSLASYKNVFYQIKRTQNEVLSRKAHWLAEGGLECGFAKVKMESDLSIITNTSYLDAECNSSGNKTIISKLASAKYSITSDVNIDVAKSHVSKNFTISGGRLPGTIKATSDLILDSSGGNYDVYPDPGQKSGDDYECVLLRYGGKVKIIGKVINKGLHWSYPPYDGFHDDVHTWPSCKLTHQSTVVNNEIDPNKVKPSVFGEDYQQLELNYDPFKDVFHVPRKDWEKVKEKSAKVTGSLNCSSDIASKISKDSLRIWVEGNCDLGTNANVIQEKITELKVPGVVIVVQDGILSVNGAQTLSALIYHFKSPGSSFIPTKEQWNLMSAKGDLSAEEKAFVGYFQNGAFHPKGGYVMDAPGLTAKIRGSLNFSFNSDVFKKALEDLENVSWQEGTWHDF